MKNRFSTLDVAASVNDLQSSTGMRVVNVYDIDSRTYLIKLQKPEYKCVILFECGMRLHRTSFDWPKSQFPSSFSMKFRKHIKQKRLESIQQLGVDRIVDMQFGEENRACHVIVELYDRGNIVLTDHNYIILNVLRPRTDKDNDVRFSVKEKYPIDIVRKCEVLPTRELLYDILGAAKKKEMLKRVLSSKTPFGPPVVEHGLVRNGFAPNYQLTGESIDDTLIEKVQNSLLEAAKLTDEMKTSKRGFVIYRKEQRPGGEELLKYEEYHPVLFEQFAKSDDPSLAFKEFDSFGDAVDEFYSKIEEQKSQLKAVNAERDALKKLDNVKKDHTERVEALKQAQIDQEIKAERIIANTEIVERAIVTRFMSAIANKLSWEDIDEKRAAAAAQGDSVAQTITKIKLDSNQITLMLKDPTDPDATAMEVDIDLALTVYQNSRKYFSDKKAASKKEQKTIESSTKALKSAQAKTKQTIDKANQKVDALVRQRKPMWFEKFFWFISSENYLVIGGRDAHQNEMLVKRYLRANDVYVHADVRGASSVVVRNKGAKCEDSIPPKTLEEAGTFSICYSTAWEAKVVVNAWWVKQDQVSRTAPTGEYLPTGSFMIRGKKNYLPGSQMQMGFGLLFRLDEDSLERHQGERKVCASAAESVCESVNDENDEEIDLSDAELNDKSDDSDDDTEESEFPDIQVGLAATRISQNDKGEEYSILQLGPTTGKGGRRQPTAREQYLEKLREEEEQAKAEERKKFVMGQSDKPLTKRQKHKMDKIKKRYKDQDDEERALRVELLASSNKAKVVKGKRRQRQADAAAEEARLKFGPHAPKKDNETIEEKDKIDEKQLYEENVEAEEDNEGVEDENIDEDDSKEDEDEMILNSLTWKPVSEDTILNVVAVVAPYQAMNGFKFKVKLTPGTGKRGKAAKSAMALFQRDKSATLPEAKLISALAATDERLAHSIPGKVRVSAPELFRKKK